MGSPRTHRSAAAIATTALFTAASLVLSFVQIPIFPAAPWLMYDPSGIVCLIAALLFGPGTGAAVAIVSWLPRLFIDPFGAPMGMLATCAFVIPAAIVFVRDRTRGSAVAGMVIGALLSVSLSCLANLYVTPLYAGIGTAEVSLMIAPILLPFNALKAIINIAVAQVLYAPVVRLAQARGILPQGKAPETADGGTAPDSADGAGAGSSR